MDSFRSIKEPVTILGQNIKDPMCQSPFTVSYCTLFKASYWSSFYVTGKNVDYWTSLWYICSVSILKENYFLVRGSPTPNPFPPDLCLHFKKYSHQFCHFCILSESLCIYSLYLFPSIQYNWLTYHPCSPEKIMFCPDPLHKYSMAGGLPVLV
jgi:hypothetical protein